MLSILIPFYNLVLLPFSLLRSIEVEIIASLEEIRKRVYNLRFTGNKIGFVPTMGALHSGHEKLVRHAVSTTDITIASIFVNPIQFNNPIDFEKYPRTLEADLIRLESAGCSIAFTPTAEQMYPEPSGIRLSADQLQNKLEGKFRPGHFEGVLLVVSKLFHLVPANIAFFGQKDWQQYLLIRQLVKDLAMDIRVESVETVREADGLAMSSRNARLTTKGRENAAVFYKALQLARQELLKGKPVKEVSGTVVEEINKVQGVQLEYFEVAHSETLEPVERVDKDAGRVSLFIAGYIDGVRLIDNIFLKEEQTLHVN